MAQPNFDMPVPPALAGRKPKTSVYVVLLVIALVALLVGCLFLFLEIKRFGGFGAVRGRVAAATLHSTFDGDAREGGRMIVEG